ncbi:hypothetical protein FNU76_07795 [Chitinimonas arctica]|uniref:Uncharacterized protein n=1 Tax=Chitinimonas arctica TaxID=2594795 RepID=A0A516SDQ8_9NEIS|nr:hypothetical protein [Chitinimonas arctica]QDQ26270.1 hypothetical protein FNU76_07795 [Chitinimonas arctica]
MSEWFRANRLPLVILLAGGLMYANLSRHIFERPSVRSSEEMTVVTPAPLQLLFAAGDRYLAANIATFRALTVGVHELKPETYHVLAQVQLRAAMLNPRQEDNYYTASAILPWNGQYQPAQQVLQRATDARLNDAMPPFFHGFNRYYFERDYIGAGKDMIVAANRSEPVNRSALSSIAARWFERGYQPKEALAMIDGMAKQSANPQLTRILQARSQRLKGLLALREATERFEQKTGRKPAKLEELLTSGVLSALPQDPLGAGYTLRADGEPDIVRPKKP